MLTTTSLQPVSFLCSRTTGKCLTSLLQSFGKIYTYFNVKWTYLSALCLFESELFRRFRARMSLTIHPQLALSYVRPLRTRPRLLSDDRSQVLVLPHCSQVCTVAFSQWITFTNRFFRRNDHSWLFCTSKKNADLHWLLVQHVWHCVGRWTHSRWCLDGQGFVAVVFLGEFGTRFGEIDCNLTHSII